MSVKGRSARAIINPRNVGGRPRVSAEPMSTVSTWLPASAHDKLIKVAQAQDVSVAALVRNVLILNVINVTVVQSKNR